MAEEFCIDVKGIMERLPHRPPFLLLDGIVSCEPGKSIVAVKNVSFNEPYVVGHVPEQPVMPGVLVVEALAQAAGVLVFESIPRDEWTFVLYLAGIEKTRFKRPVGPGDQLTLKSELLTRKRNIWRFSTEATVGNELVANAEMLQAGRPR